MKIRNLISKILLKSVGSSVTIMAMMVTAINVNTTCAFVIHQPELPKTAKKLRKF